MSTKRITMTMANDAAEKISVKAFESKINEAKAKVNAQVELLVKKYIPAPVIACAKEYSKYLYTYKRAEITTLTDNGSYTSRASYIYGELSFELPNSCSTVDVDIDDYRELSAIEKKLESVKLERSEFQDKIYNTLLALRTVNNVSKEFPEAMEYLDIPEEKQLPSLMLGDLRKIVSGIK